MKGNLFTIIFFIIFIILASLSDADTKELIQTKKMKNRIEDSYMSAVDSAVDTLKLSFEHDEKLNKEKAAETFFYTLYAGLGILDDPYLKEQVDLYVPVMAVVINDGFYILYNDEYKNAGKTEVRKMWSELIPFDHEDEFFIYRFTLSDTMTVFDKKNLLQNTTPVISLTYKSLQENFVRSTSADHVIRNEEKFNLFRQNVITDKIDEYLTYYINQNNYIAERHDITYHFFFPDFDQSEWIRSINEVSMMVFFQGYPYNNGRNIYNQFVISGASLKRPGNYYIVPKDYYYIYHTSGCPDLIENEIKKTVHSLISCAEAGAYPCATCN